MSYLFFFLRYQIKCVLKPLFKVADVINFKVYLESSFNAMTERENQREDGNANILIFREGNKLFRRNQNIFNSF